MQEALDIYIKLLIAIISFIAPLLINLLSIFSDGIAVKKRRFEEYQNQTTAILKDSINQGVNISKLITEDGAAFEEKKKANNDQLDLLDPKKQIKNIFPTFFYSLLLIIVNRLVSDNQVDKVLNIKNDYINPLLTISFLLSLYFAQKGVKILVGVVWAIIDVKQEIAEDNAKEKQQSKTEKVILLNDNSKI